MWSTIHKVAAIILLSALSKGELPEDDFRIINRQDLLASNSDIFEDNSTRSFSQLLFDVARDQVIVGARDALYRISLRELHQVERAGWFASPEKTKLCQDKGQTEEDCHNYIKVLLSNGHKLFACGTNAGVAHCPYNPRSNVTALLAASGEYFVGTPTDFSSSDFAITKYNDAGGVLMMKENWSTFLKARVTCSVPGDVPFYYDQVQSVDNSITGSAVCMYNMSDIHAVFDGPYKVQDSPTSTWEARTPPRQLRNRFHCGPDSRTHEPIEYNRYHLMAEAVTPISGGPVYRAASQRFSHITVDVTAAKNIDKQYVLFISTESGNVLKLSVLPGLNGACLIEKWRLQDEKGGFDVLKMQFVKETMSVYIGSTTGVIRIGSERCARFKSRAGCVGAGDPHCGWDDARELCVRAASRVRDPSFVQSTAVCPSQDIPDPHCGWDDARELCVRAASRVRDPSFVQSTAVCPSQDIPGMRATPRGIDPHCGWDDARELCVRAASRVRDPSFVQSIAVCPSQDIPVDGGWSAWSEWEPCMQDGTYSSLYGSTHSDYGEKPDMCMCRKRNCDNPRPVNGGQNCKDKYIGFPGVSVSVANCTVHGGWSSWSGWSECSATCGIAVKSRRRTCTSPEPRFGGRVCVGLDADDVYCANLAPCPAWGPWTQCTSAGGAGCGASAGWRERRRTCTNPSPRHGGSDCDGTKIERQICDMRPCELRKATAWTPWVQIPGNTSDGSYTEKRFKFLCKAPSPEQIKLSIAREEERYCNARGSCSNSPPEESGWEEWGPWESCTAACGGGQQARRRRYSEAGWGEWGEWGACEHGERVRQRSCCLLCLATVIVCQRRGSRMPWKKPHRPRKAKRQPSFTGIGGSSGIVLSKSNNLSNANNHNSALATPKLYPKAIANEYDSVGTLRRHSNQPNNKNNIDVEEDKFY
ncbi:Semaphorin-5c [Operophtera brumata]|uniref:Semaphorin-5c n=1 Tax=Operophtera brumata TaxID=104452 RepID=A0A0L7LPM2_OPEBR|nr:Semaphorin-5c [Operophtera brumata]